MALSTQGNKVRAAGRPKSAILLAAELIVRIGGVAVLMVCLLCLAYFPWRTDDPLSTKDVAALEDYYAKAYREVSQPGGEEEGSRYVRIAAQFASTENIQSMVRSFVRQYGLEDKRILDVGAGRGYLQDIVPDYVGLDISPSARRFFHKPFVHGSATHMPLTAASFDAAWSIWVLEHVPNPEAALQEMCRVVRPNGLLFLKPAWKCSIWAADGYPVRPYSGFGIWGKVLKASMPAELYLRVFARKPVRLLRHAAWRTTGQQTRFRYTALKANFNEYWMEDSDAINSFDRHELALWFLSRGHECLNCEGDYAGVDREDDPLIIRLRNAPMDHAPRASASLMRPSQD